MKGLPEESFVGLRAMLIAGSVFRQANSGTGVPPVNHAQDARATTKLINFADLVLWLKWR
jgi:hypothetical protein